MFNLKLDGEFTDTGENSKPIEYTEKEIEQVINFIKEGKREVNIEKILVNPLIVL